MKVFLFISVTWAWISVLPAQTDLYNAIGRGDVSVISAYFGDEVELSILGSEGVYTKTEATGQIRNFFSAHQARGFRQMHTGASKGKDSNYIIGELDTDRGVYRVYLYFGPAGDRRMVREFRIERTRG